MKQATLDYYIPLCNCEGCFKDSTKIYLMDDIQFEVCDYHKIELEQVTVETVESKLITDIGEALAYREETFQYNSKP